MKIEQHNQIKVIIQTLLDKMGVSGAVEFMKHPDGDQFIIKTKDGGILIGDNGKHLVALSHIVKRITDKEVFLEDSLEDKPHIFIDINDYQRQKIEELKELAKMSAQRVRYFKKDVAMEPMNAYDRRIIHASLTEYPDITTESAGEGLERRVVIKPYL